MNAKYYKLLITLAVVGIVIAIAFAGLLLMEGAPKKNASKETKEPAPNFTLLTISNGEFHFSDHKGKPALVNFFASWCLPCRDEMPVLEKIAREYSQKGVVFVGVGVDDTEDKMKEFIARYGVTFPVGLDKTAAIQKSFNLYGIPTTYFISKQGIITYFHAGGVTEELLRHELDKLL